MIRSGKEILADIDATLDQLIQNAEAVRNVSVKILSEQEVGALKKTQESLLARLMDMNKLLETEKRKPLQSGNVEKKIAAASALNTLVVKRFKGKEKEIKRLRLPRTNRSSYC